MHKARNLAGACYIAAGTLLSAPEGQAADAFQKPEAVMQAAKVVWSMPATKREIFITIADGWFPSTRVLGLMRRHHIPITAFLVKDAMVLHEDYWKTFVRYGGSIQDHTISHPSLTEIGRPEIYYQICSDATYISASFRTPIMMRPPYGAYNQNVLYAAHGCGIRYVVMWDAQVQNGAKGYGLIPRVATWNGKPLHGGEIVLLHWVPGLYNALKEVLREARSLHLKIGDLGSALRIKHGA